MSVVMQIVKVRIKPGMEHKWSKSTYERVEEWLKHWTCPANFKAVIEDSRDEALAHCRRTLYGELVPSWLNRESGVNPEDFEFEVSEQDVKHGEFWMSYQVVWAHWHSI